VHVTNNLAEGQAIHWHGILQNGTQYMDGVPGFSQVSQSLTELIQCSIPANGGNFTYTFAVTGQYGSYWWHSHYGNTMADGLVGGLIVHSVNDPLKLGTHFDEERVLMLADWVDAMSETVIDDLHAGVGFDGSRAPPQGDAILVNGVVSPRHASLTSGPNQLHQVRRPHRILVLRPDTSRDPRPG
jgi:FtsP/CotA-like multicopper oxidase with cupredoxin domain